MNRPDGVRHPCCSRLAFQIWPHDAQRQYVAALTSLLVVLTSTELQNGQVLGATPASVGWVCIKACLSALGIVSLSHPLFGYPLMADAPEVTLLIAPAP